MASIRSASGVFAHACCAKRASATSAGRSASFVSLTGGSGAKSNGLRSARAMPSSLSRPPRGPDRSLALEAERVGVLRALRAAAEFPLGDLAGDAGADLGGAGGLGHARARDGAVGGDLHLDAHRGLGRRV